VGHGLARPYVSRRQFLRVDDVLPPTRGSAGIGAAQLLAAGAASAVTVRRRAADDDEVLEQRERLRGSG